MKRAPRLRTRLRWCPIVSTIVLAVASARTPAASAAQPAQPVYDVNALDQEFAAAARENPKLQGAWIDLEYEPAADESRPGNFTVRRVLDSSRADIERSEIDRVLRAWLPAGRYQVKPKGDR